MTGRLPQDQRAEARRDEGTSWRAQSRIYSRSSPGGARCWPSTSTAPWHRSSPTAAADLRPRTRACCEAAQLYPVTVISGRTQADMRSGSGRPVRNMRGGPRGRTGPRVAYRLQWPMFQWRSLRPGARGTARDEVRRQRHFGGDPLPPGSRHKKARKKGNRAAVAGSTARRIVGGKHVLNVLPEGAPDKGTAFEAISLRVERDTGALCGRRRHGRRRVRPEAARAADHSPG